MDNHDRQTDNRPELSHDELRAQLPMYVADLVLRNALPAQYDRLVAHLGECAGCRAEAEELAELLRDAAAGTLPQAPSYPPLNLDFLRNRASLPWSLDDLGRLVVRFSAALLEQIRPAALPALARSTGRRGAQLYQYEQARFAPAESRQPASLTISVFGVGATPEAVEVVVRVGVAGRRATDLAGSEVILAVGPDERRGLTDKFGYASFPDIPAAELPNLQVVVAPMGDRPA